MKLFKWIVCIALTISYSSMIAMKALKEKQEVIAHKAKTTAQMDELQKAIENMISGIQNNQELTKERKEALSEKLKTFASKYPLLAYISDATEKFHQVMAFKIKIDRILVDLEWIIDSKIRLPLEQALDKIRDAALEGYLGFSLGIMQRRAKPTEYRDDEKEFFLENMLPKGHPWTAIFQDNINIKTIASQFWVKHMENPEKGVDVWIKWNGWKRIATKRVIRKIIEKEKLDQIRFPEEYVIFIDKNSLIVRPQRASDIIPDMEIYLISQNIEYGQKPIKKSQAKQMGTLLKMFDRFDLGGSGTEGNIRIDPAGNLYLIDVEPKGNPYATGLPKFCSLYIFDDEAKQYLNQALEELDPTLAKLK